MPKEAQQEEGWETMESGGFLKFDEPGDGFTGVVTGYAVKNTSKGEANEYIVYTKDGRKSFYAPKGLHDGLSGCIIKYGLGEFIAKVEYKEKIKTASGNDFKVFDVMHRKKTDELVKELGIEMGDGDF